MLNEYNAIDPDSVGFRSWLTDWVSPAPTTNQGTKCLGFQRWFPFKEAFSPSFVADIISRKKRKPTTVLDPFSGSGTTALTCQFLGIHPITIEVNPFLADLTEVKLQTYDIDELIHFKRSIFRLARERRNDALLTKYLLPPTFVEPGINGRWLFNIDTARDLLSFRSAIEECKSEKMRRLGKVVLGSIFVPASNAVVNGKGRRYRVNWKERLPIEVDLLIGNAINAVIEDAVLTTKKAYRGYTLFRGDARDQINKITDLIDLALFSPPYPNSFDYTDVYNIELWMLGYLSSRADNRLLREKTIRSHVQVKRDYSTTLTITKSLSSIYKQLSEQRKKLWDVNIPEMVCAYFDDLLCVIANIANHLSENGSIELVVGDSQYAGVKISVPKVLAEILPTRGLEVLRVETVRAMRSSAQQGGQHELCEYLVKIARM